MLHKRHKLARNGNVAPHFILPLVPVSLCPLYNFRDTGVYP